MTLVEVTSSNIKRVGWENNNLFIEFTNGLYKYVGVDQITYQKLLEADSKGKFVGAEIRNKYKFEKIY